MMIKFSSCSSLMTLLSYLWYLCFYDERFNGTALLESLNGKRMVFVGDSLNRGQWVSMVCLLDSIISNPSHKSKHSNGSLITFRSKVSEHVFRMD